MRLVHRHLSIFILGTALLLLVMSVVHAQGGYTLSWYRTGHAGAVSSGGSFTLVGASGQSDAAHPTTGESYTLAGGFLTGGDEPPPTPTPEIKIYLPHLRN